MGILYSYIFGFWVRLGDVPFCVFVLFLFFAQMNGENICRVGFAIHDVISMETQVKWLCQGVLAGQKPFSVANIRNYYYLLNGFSMNEL